MPLIGLSLTCLAIVALNIITLRHSGGWLCLWRLRTAQDAAWGGRTWTELYPVEKGWFYAVPIFSFVGLISGIAGSVVLA